MHTAKTSSKKVKETKEKRAAQAGAKATPEEIKTRRLDRVREPLLAKALAEYGVDASGTLAERADRLDAHFRNTVPFKKWIVCVPDDAGGCGLVGPDVPACPFCGAVDIDEGDKAELARQRAEETEGKALHGSKAALTIVPKASPTPTIVEGTIEEAEHPAVASRLAELDEAVSRVVAAHAAGVGSYWDLGRALLPIFEKQLYLQRRHDDGTPRYRGWTQFLEGEFRGQIAAGHSYRVMDVARRFDRETAVRIGVAKLSILVRAKEDALPKLLQSAEKQSVKEVIEASKPFLIPAGQRDTGRDDRPAAGKGKAAGSVAGRKSAVADNAKRAEARADNAITVATVLGTVEIPLFAKGSKDKLARKIADDPVGEEVHANAVVTSYSVIIGGDGGLKLRVVRRRVKG